MPDTEKSRRRAKAREYFSTHSIEDEPGEEVDVEVKPALSVMLSLRLDAGHYEKLRTLAKAQKTGLTTLARDIIQEALDDPGHQLLMHTLKSNGVREELTRLLAESKIPPGDGEPDFLVIPVAELDKLAQLVRETAQEMWLKVLQAKAITVTPEQHDLHEKLRSLDPASR